MGKTCCDCGIAMPYARKDKLRCAGCNRKHRTKLALARSRAAGQLPRGVAKSDIICNCCGIAFRSERKSRRWCDKCRTIGRRGRRNLVLTRSCQWCGNPWTFKRGNRSESNKRYCSDGCRRSAALESRADSRERERNGAAKIATGRPKTRPDGFSRKYNNGSLQTRFFLLNPDRPKKCEACGESRVVDLAHKVARRSSWRKLPKSSEVWILCPTCHRCLDGGIETPQSLGLSP